MSPSARGRGLKWETVYKGDHDIPTACRGEGAVHPFSATPIPGKHRSKTVIPFCSGVFYSYTANAPPGALAV